MMERVHDYTIRWALEFARTPRHIHFFAPIFSGAWRDGSAGPMQVVSGGIGREKVHFEAPPAERIEKEMLIAYWSPS